MYSWICICSCTALRCCAASVALNILSKIVKFLKQTRKNVKITLILSNEFMKELKETTCRRLELRIVNVVYHKNVFVFLAL